MSGNGPPVIFTTRYCKFCRTRSAWMPSTGCVVCMARSAPNGLFQKPNTLADIPYTVHEAKDCQHEEDLAVAKRIKGKAPAKTFLFDGQAHTAESFEGHPMFPTERKISKTRSQPILCNERLVVLTGRIFYHYSHHEGK